MSHRLLAVLRRPEILVAVVSQRRADFERVSRTDVDPYIERAVPLAQTPESICPWRDKDVKAWRALGSVGQLNSRAALAIVRTLIGSVAWPIIDIVPAPLASAQRGVLDLRPLLCHPSGEQQLIEQMRSVLDALTADDATEFPSWHWSRRLELAALPAEFRRLFLWGLHLSSWRQLELTLAAFDALELDQAPPLRRAVARLLSMAPRDVGLAWCGVLAELQPGARTRGAELILESGAVAMMPTEAAAAALERAAHHGADAPAELVALSS